MLRSFFFAFAVLVSHAAYAQDAPPKLAKIVEVVGNTSEVTRQFFGHVAAKETVDLAFQVGGQIVEIPIVEGEPVARGAVIATLDLEPFELALDQARVQRDQAERTLKRLQALEGNTVSQVTVDDAETQQKLAEIAVRNAERSLRDAQLLSPFDALVASRNVANFTTIAAGTPVARLHDLSELRVEIDVPEVLFQQAGENPDVELFAKFPSSEERFPLETREFNAETSQVGQTFQITLGMPPPEGLVVLPGSSVTVFATLKGGPSTLRIPGSAVIAANDGSTQVMIFSPAGAEEGTVSLTPVTIKPGPRGEVLVEAGLEAGQEIIASGANMLAEGETVRRFTGFSN
ncbi:MAG: efflux RND transporter periplasmic adaptor subunit [Litoreibacter sp.]|nr:efflux RND transporter periplasmic adaptor subunit [Litoreibacter sp.]